MVRSFLLSLLLLSTALPARAEVPVVENPLLEGAEPTVDPKIPTAKALLLPISASTADGERVTVTATSSNPAVLVRVRTGNPLLKLTLHHDKVASDSTDVTYDRVVVFQLFRDLAPETVGFMSGFAQAGYFEKPEEVDTDGDPITGPGRIFRLADFGAVDGQAHNSFIFQGGSPTGVNTGSVGFAYENEFNPAAIFAGSGQLAMANSGYNLTTRRGSNGSQYFLTYGTVRQLDFKHTIWGQVSHGWDTLRILQKTPRKTTATATPDPGTPDYPRIDQPNSPIRITSAAVIPQFALGGRTFTDAMLVLSATAPGTAEITVTATNAMGETGTRTFSVTAADEARENNSRPYLTPLADAAISKRGQANLGFGVVDLERDYVTLGQALGDNGTAANPKGISGLIARNVMGVIGNPSYKGTSGTAAAADYTGPVLPAVNVTQYEMDGTTREVDNYSASQVAVGESKVTPEETTIFGAPNVELNSAVVARFRDADPRGQAANFSAQVNWGDGTAVQTGVITPDTTKATATGFQVASTHTYPRAGIYTAITTISSTLGLRERVKSTVVITTSPIHAAGEDLVLAGPTVANRILATFTDTSGASSATAYTATIDWGDGVVGPGSVRAAGAGKFKVLGKHSYRDAERFAVTVKIEKNGTASEALAWSSVQLTKFKAKRHLPPFDQAHLIAALSAVPVDHSVPSGAVKATKQTAGTIPTDSRTYFSYQMQIVNSGNIASKPGKLRFLLSADEMLDAADRPLQITALDKSEFFLPAIPAGASIVYYFEKGKYADYRLAAPANETGTGHFLLIAIDYDDPIAKHQPIDRVAQTEKINGIIVEPTIVSTRESGTTGTFSVKLDKAPTATVTIPVTFPTASAAEGSIDKTSLVFTSANWNTAQVVTVTGKSDTPTTGTTYGRDGTKTYKITLGTTTTTDTFYKDLDAPDVTVSNADRDNNIGITPTSLTVAEREGTNHERIITISLKRAPTAPVSITITATKNAEVEIVGGTPDTADPLKKVFTFMPAEEGEDAQLATNVTIRGKDDIARDGNQTLSLTFTVASTDKEFDGLFLPTVSITSLDNGNTATP